MEVGEPRKYIYSDVELDQHEGREIAELMASSQHTLPDPDRWLDEDIHRNIMLTTVDAVIGWARSSSLWPAICFPA